MSGYSREEAIEEDGIESVLEWEEKEYVKSLNSYEGLSDDDIRHCTRCGQLMKYNSMAYWEGYHFDSCY
jgi:hypothetical protein